LDEDGGLEVGLRQLGRHLLPVLRIHDILGWIRIRIRGSMPLDLQDANKKLNFLHNFFCLLLFEGTFTSFFKDK
jgi:hypothetical protein